MTTQQQTISREQSLRAMLRHAPTPYQVFQDRKMEEVRSLDTNTLLKCAYVPFVILELAWDYVDTIVDMLKSLRISETRKVTRALADIRKSYDELRFEIITDVHRKGERVNMLAVEGQCSKIMKLFRVNLMAEIKSKHPDLNQLHVELLQAVYECHAMIDCAVEYAQMWRAKLSKRMSRKTHCVLPPQVQGMKSLVLELAGDKALSQKFLSRCKEFSRSMANQVSLMGFSDEPIESSPYCN